METHISAGPDSYVDGSGKRRVFPKRVPYPLPDRLPNLSKRDGEPQQVS